MSRGVRYPRPPPIKDKCKHELVESTKVYLCVRKSGLIYPPWKWEIAGSNPATQTSYVVLSVPVRTSLCESDRMGSTPIDQPKISTSDLTLATEEVRDLWQVRVGEIYFGIM